MNSPPISATDFEPVMAAMRRRAPVDLRVNTLKTSTPAAIAALARDAVLAEPHPLVAERAACRRNPRLVAQSRAYTQGLVELQDVSSQFAAAAPASGPA
jgi:16S rRNA (cytosine967-C5)-methyltransferase